MTKPDFDIVLYGGPGTGKGTQAEILSTKLSGIAFSMGAALRALAASDKPQAQEVRDRIDEGRLVDHRITAKLADEVMESAGTQTIIFDGYPRDEDQIEDFEKGLAEYGRTAKMFFLELPLSVARERLLKRAEIENRADDTPEGISERIEIFRENSKSLLKHFENQNSLVTVDADGTREEVADRLFKKIMDGSA